MKKRAVVLQEGFSLQARVSEEPQWVRVPSILGCKESVPVAETGAPVTLPNVAAGRAETGTCQSCLLVSEMWSLTQSIGCLAGAKAAANARQG